jgi:hypothetical protein
MIKLNINHKEKDTVKLSQLMTGSVFKYAGAYCLDVGYARPEDSEYCSDLTHWLAFSLTNNCYLWVLGSEKVTPITDVSVNIED